MIDILSHALTSGFNQGQCFKLSSQQHLLQVPIGRGKSDVAHIPDHDVLHTDIILPETWRRGAPERGLGRRGETEVKWWERRMQGDEEREMKAKLLAVIQTNRWTHRLTRGAPCPARGDKEVSWCGWWSRTVMVGVPGPRRWPGSRRSSQAGCGRSDQSAQTLWPLWIQCGWLLQTTLQHLRRRDVN